MGSYNYGKYEVCDWIRHNFPLDSSILDVGACDAKWRILLHEYQNMDAVEIFEPNAVRIQPIYANVYNMDIYDFKYEWYDLIIFGDVIEHMTVERAREVLEYARNRCKQMIVAVPFEYFQPPIYGNQWEEHIQDDLTRENFNERYPGFKVLWDNVEDYCYYIKA